MKKSKKKTKNKTPQSIPFNSGKESIHLDNMERKISKLTDLATTGEIQSDMDLNEAAKLLDDIDTELAKGIEARQTIENKVPPNVPIKHSSYFNNRLFMTLGISTIAVVLLVIGNQSNQSTDPLTPLAARKVDKKLVAPMYGFTEKRGLKNTITLEEYDNLVTGLPVYYGNDGLKENIESISEGEIVRFVDGTNAKKIIYQISRKENRITELKLLFVLNDSKQGYDMHFSLDGDGDHSTSKIKGQISNWPKLKSIIEEETK